MQDKILRIFGEKLAEYAIEKSRMRDVNVCRERHIEGFERRFMHVKEVGEVKFGVAIWATGNKACNLVEGLDVKKTEKGMERVITD